VVLAGRLGGRVRSGRFVDLANAFDWNQMLATICRAMGVQVDRVGDLGAAGVIPGLLA
jgi:hypothetical protein